MHLITLTCTSQATINHCTYTRVHVWRSHSGTFEAARFFRIFSTTLTTTTRVSKYDYEVESAYKPVQLEGPSRRTLCGCENTCSCNNATRRKHSLATAGCVNCISISTPWIFISCTCRLHITQSEMQANQKRQRSASGRTVKEWNFTWCIRQIIVLGF